MLLEHCFGPSAFKHLQLTRRTACTYGQSWPELVYLPICYYFDDTVRHNLGLGDDGGFWKVVTPHKVVHQWWGGQQRGYAGGCDRLKNPPRRAMLNYNDDVLAEK